MYCRKCGKEILDDSEPSVTFVGQEFNCKGRAVEETFINFGIPKDY